MANSTLVSVKEKLEWLLNCVLPGMSKGYDSFGRGSVIELSVQSALLVRRHIGMNARNDKLKNQLTRVFF